MTTSEHGGRRRPWLPLAAVVILIAALGVWMKRRDDADMREELKRLAEQNETLKAELSTMRKSLTTPGETPEAPAPSPGSAAVAVPPSASPTNTAPAPDARESVPQLVMSTRGMSLPPRADGLMLAGAHAVPMEGGIRATMNFSPTTAGDIGLVAVVVRLPRESTGRILQFAPAGVGQFENTTMRIAESGKFAFFEGTAAQIKSLEMVLAVSGEAVADVRGTSGIGSFKLDVKPTGATIQRQNAR